MLKLPDGISVCLVDLDGVITQTAKLHSAAWKEMFDDYLRERGVEVDDGSIDFVKEAQREGLRRAVVSSSANTREVLQSVGIEDLFEAVVDGLVAQREGLPGKPAPDTFVAGARALGAEPSQAVVFEDALAGGEAGRAGGFGYVVGVDRTGQRDALAGHGADIVVEGQSESIFALSNGHIGLRGNLDEGEPVDTPGTYLNAFYEVRPLPHAETAYGLPDAGQTVVNVTNGKVIRLLVDDEPVDANTRIVLQSELVANEPVPVQADDPRAAAALQKPLESEQWGHHGLR